MLREPSGGSKVTLYSVRPSSLMRLKASTVTPEKMRLLGVKVSEMLYRH